MRKRARDAQEASEGNAHPIVRDQDFHGAMGGRGWTGLVDGCRCWQKGVRRERKSGRCDTIKETRSTRRFFLVNFTNTCYYISLIFSIIISNISCGYNLYNL